MSEKTNYANLKAKLDDLVSQLQDGDVDIDQALILYKESQQVIAKLENYLKEVKNEIKQIKKS